MFVCVCVRVRCDCVAMCTLWLRFYVKAFVDPLMKGRKEAHVTSLAARPLAARPLAARSLAGPFDDENDDEDGDKDEEAGDAFHRLPLSAVLVRLDQLLVRPLHTLYDLVHVVVNAIQHSALVDHGHGHGHNEHQHQQTHE